MALSPCQKFVVLLIGLVYRLTPSAFIVNQAHYIFPIVRLLAVALFLLVSRNKIKHYFEQNYKI